MNRTELSSVVNLHGKAIYAFCHKLAKNQMDADDLYQDTFLKAVELCHKIDADKNTKGFLISIAIGLWKNNRRKYAWRQRIAPTKELDEEVEGAYLVKNEPSPEEMVISHELSDMIQGTVDKLNDKFKIPLYMYYTAQMSIEDIALALKIPKGTVKSRLFKARKSMKHILEVSGYEEF